MRRHAHLVLGITGTIAAVDAADEAASLAGVADRVDVVLTEAAGRFTRPGALAALGGVWSATGDGGPGPPPDESRDVDLVVVWPASAAILARLAAGAGDDLLARTIAAAVGPLVVFPAMNHRMWTAPAVARNVSLLRDDGVIVVEPEPGGEVADLGLGPLRIGAPGSGGRPLVDIVEAAARSAASVRQAPRVTPP